jgi:hypothetical protein
METYPVTAVTAVNLTLILYTKHHTTRHIHIIHAPYNPPRRKRIEISRLIFHHDSKPYHKSVQEQRKSYKYTIPKHTEFQRAFASQVPQQSTGAGSTVELTCTVKSPSRQQAEFRTCLQTQVTHSILICPYAMYTSPTEALINFLHVTCQTNFPGRPFGNVMARQLWKAALLALHCLKKNSFVRL